MSKKRKKPNTAHKPTIRLSQCMIVKNEEKNIEKALSWGKGVVYEQVVVDTGSTDRTVELAEKMGAKVVHFKWVNDFSAAKNYAIEQVSGDWVAHLDADEYFPPEDLKTLIKTLKRIQADPILNKKHLAICCPWVNVDKEGRPVSIYKQIRVFRNIPKIHYIGSIHERLDMDPDNIVLAEDIKIIHTGYIEAALIDGGKAKRNSKLLRDALAEKPDDLNLIAYLADSLRYSEEEKDREEAGELFTTIINSGHDALVHYTLKLTAYTYFMEKYISMPEKQTECEAICRKALDEFPGYLDFEYFLGYTLNNQGRFSEAWELLKKSEKSLENETDLSASVNVSADPTVLFAQLVLAAQGLGDIENVIKYVTLILVADKKRPGTLLPYIATLVKRGATTDELIALLKTIYDFNDPQDLLYIARTAMECRAIELAKTIIALAG